MPPKATKAKPRLKCIKFGEILIDENKKVMLLCINCLTDFINFQEFCNHLRKCAAIEHLFNASGKDKKLDCETGNLLANFSQTTRELLVYGVNPNKTTDEDSDCVINIEEEILNPRWYTDPPQATPKSNKDTATYNNLIEEVTPFVHFKENVRTLSTPIQIKSPQKQSAIRDSKNKQNSLPTPAKDIKLIGKQDISNLSANKIKAKHTLTSNIATSPLKRKATSLESSAYQKSATSTIRTQPPVKCQRTVQAINNVKNSTQQSTQATLINVTKSNTNINSTGSRIPQQVKRTRQQKILNAQINLTSSPGKGNANCNNGLISVLPQIQKNPSVLALPNSSTIVTAASAPTKDKTTVDILNKLQTLGLKIQRTNPTPTTLPTPNKKNDAALEIIKKLQSKGMEVKRVPKSNLIKINSSPENATISRTETVPNSLSSAALRRSTSTIKNNVFFGKPNLQ